MTRIAWPLRAWLVVEVLFGLAAMSSIALSPADTATNFAWPIQPEATAALLGAFYLSSAWVFVLAALAQWWEDVRVMMIPAILFTSAELVATFLHWDRFTLTSAPFYIWFASYLLPPPILAACYLWQQRRASPGRAADAQPYPLWLRVLMLALGALLTVDGLMALIWPQNLIGTTPWQLTPLTTRAISGWMIALGTMLLGTAWDNDRRRARVLSPFFILLLPAVAWELSRFAGQVDWTHWRIFVNGGVLLVVMGIGVYLATAGWRGFFVWEGER